MADLATSLAKLIPLLGSDKIGEVAAAAGMISKALRREKKDWHDLAKAASRGMGLLPPPREETMAPPHVGRILLIQAHANRGRMTNWEKDFVKDLLARGLEELTSRQDAKLTAIEVKLGIKRYAWR